MSLHSTTASIKKIVLVFAIIIGVIIAVNITIGIIKSLLPHKKVPPTVAFGQLPPISFPPTTQSQTTHPAYVLNTVSGMFPLFSDRVKVYKIKQPEPDILALNNVKALIPRVDFPNEPQSLSDTIYQWQSPNPPNKILTYNLLSHNFTLTSSYATDINVITAANLQDEQHAISIGNLFLSSFNTDISGIDAEKTKTTLYSINATTQTLQPAISLATTQIIQMDFFQKDIDKLPVYYPNTTHSLITLLFGSLTPNTGTQNIVEAHVTHQSITSSNGTYPIKTAEEAFKELQTASPSAYIAATANPPTDIINIRTISLGYYIGENPQLYLMPIVVFQGDNGFLGYVTAITDTLIQKQPDPTGILK